MAAWACCRPRLGRSAKAEQQFDLADLHAHATRDLHGTKPLVGQTLHLRSLLRRGSRRMILACLRCGGLAKLTDAPLRIRRCQRRGTSTTWSLTLKPTDTVETPDGGVVQPITFYPDGSCDSAVIEVVDADQQEQTKVGRLEIDGSTGTMDLQVLTPTEYQELMQRDLEAKAP